ncbi:hypothetical protein MTR_1g069600 [Medicago truncatula]|uniref:ARID domain-containing protein n=1 Tax=Medicago truncatula TaxID=3880 RepID=A0A072VKE0_MEDTR|nr:hypothetical protein MTR_1g069600 [Medicago truncatula]
MLLMKLLEYLWGLKPEFANIIGTRKEEKGGYAAVSRKGLWDSVIVDLGLDLNVLASVKLVYEKYLSDFEGWLSKTSEEKSFKNWNGTTC